ncbi:MAG: metallophosphoesterase [Verrucomicrobiae bacterium]|nr:metallophosphoesterase [Verrucomicrobiae bacterium]
MPGLLYQPVDRRRFLKFAGLAGSTLPWVGQGVRGAEPDSAPDRLHLALLSDTHIPGDRKNGHRGFNPWENLLRIAPDVVAVRPQGVIINGDAARLAGYLEDYQELAALLKPVAEVAPVYVGLGNHDDRANFFRVFEAPPGQRQEIAGKHVVVIEHPAVRVVVLDSLLYVDKVAGLLGRAQRQWLADFLPAQADRPMVFFVHHTLGDGDGDLLDADRMFELFRPHAHVKAVFYGHSHVWGIRQRDTLQLINLPAVGYNFRDSDPVGWVDAWFDPTGVDLTLRAFAGNREEDGRKTRVRWL